MKLKTALTALSVVAGLGSATYTTVTQVVEHYEYNNIHEIVETDVYYINGQEVTQEEFENYLNNKSNSSEENVLDDIIEANHCTYFMDAEYMEHCKEVGYTFDYMMVYSDGTYCIPVTEEQAYYSIVNTYENDTAMDYAGFTFIQVKEDNDYSDYVAQYLYNCSKPSDIHEAGFRVLKNVTLKIWNTDTCVEYASSSNDNPFLYSEGDRRYWTQFIFSYEECFHPNNILLEKTREYLTQGNDYAISASELDNINVGDVITDLFTLKRSYSSKGWLWYINANWYDSLKDFKITSEPLEYLYNNRDANWLMTVECVDVINNKPVFDIISFNDRVYVDENYHKYVVYVD